MIFCIVMAEERGVRKNLLGERSRTDGVRNEVVEHNFKILGK